MIYLNGKSIEFKNFPNGECYADVKKEDVKAENLIELHFENDTDILHLMFLKDYIDNTIKHSVCYLNMPYVPYSRMDRQENNRLFTLKSLANIINDMDFEAVHVWEPHSDVTTALFNNIIVHNITRELFLMRLQEILNLKGDSWRKPKSYMVETNAFSIEGLYEAANKENIWIVYPDAGAEKRYSKQIGYNKVMVCSKTRDFNTGRITSLEIKKSGDIGKNATAIIVDDLCSKGGTFVLAISKLRLIGVENVDLVVTHCENTAFTGDLFKCGFKEIWTTNSILSKLPLDEYDEPYDINGTKLIVKGGF